MIAAINPRPAFAALFLQGGGAFYSSENKEADGLLVTKKWRERNRRASVPLSTLSRLHQYVEICNSEVSEDQAAPAPAGHRWSDAARLARFRIPLSEWPHVLALLKQGVSLRQVAAQYGVSYESVRRVQRAWHELQQKGALSQEEWS